MRKKLSLFLACTLSFSLLAGCSAGNRSAVYDIPSMTLDEVQGSRLVAATNAEVESTIYDYVSDRIVVDGSKLISVSNKDAQNITNLMASINMQLSGRGGNALIEEYANYLLLEFAKTPYEWNQANMDIVGFDPAARLYFVDVTYATTNTYKSVVPDSKIANGDPEGDMLKQKRYADYMTMMTYYYNGNEKYDNARSTFIRRWGELKNIFDEQQGVSLYERTMEKGSESGGIGKLTYSGLVSDNILATGARMTVRYVLKYRLNLGEETDLEVEALYLKNYNLNNYEQILSSYNLRDEAALEVLKPFIDQLILSYHKCVEESNHVGLFKLFDNYSNIDKYYDEIRDYTYNSIGGYAYRILERKNEGRELAVRVDRVNQIRARGANMSLPTYEETWVYNMVLNNNDTITIKDTYLLNSTMIGEPLSVIKNVTGISEQIQYSDVAFSAVNEAAVQELMRNFSQIVTNSDYSSADFLNYVDLGVSQTTLNRMVDTIRAIVPNRKYMYIVSWDTKTNVYCSVTVREVFECQNGNFDTEAVIDMGNRNGVWKVVNYTRTLNIKTNETVMDTSTAFCTNERTTEGQTTIVQEINNNPTTPAPQPQVQQPNVQQPEVQQPEVNQPETNNPTIDDENDDLLNNPGGLDQDNELDDDLNNNGGSNLFG